MNENYEDTLPLMLAPVRQIGLQVALGLRGFPSNRIVMVYGPPGGGKSSLSFLTAGEYRRNQDEVWVRETEHALDRIYMASYLPADLSGEELHKAALEHWKKKTKSLLNKNDKAKEDDKFLAPNTIEVMNKRLEDIDTRLRELKEGIPSEETSIVTHRYKSLMRNAIAEYKLKDISIEHPKSLEAFESEVIAEIDKKQADKNRRFKRLLIIVDSLSYLLPKEDVEKATSSDGRGLMTAKYLHMLLPRLLGRISGHEITLMFIIQQTTFIKMNPYQSASAIDSVAGKGGLAIKFGATFMIGVEQRAKTNNVESNEVKTGCLKMPKAKLRGGGQGPNEGRFYLQEGVEESAMDFNEPLVLNILNNEEFGILKNRGYHYVPGDLLKSHPAFESEIAPKLKPKPKKKAKAKDEDDEDETETPAETPSTSSDEPLYFCGYAVEVMPILLNTPRFLEKILDKYDVVESV